MNRTTVSCLAVTLAAWLTASAAESAVTSTDVFEARAYRVDQASDQHSALTPVVDISWDFDEAIPYSDRQTDIVLLAGDPLAIWFPEAASVTSLSGPRMYLDQMPQVDMLTHTVTFDRYHRLESLIAPQVVAGAVESGYWIGHLAAGDYEVVVNDWSLPGIESDPLAGLLGPPTLTTPWSLDIPNAALAGSTSWRFSVIPEPSALLLLLMGMAVTGRRQGLV